VDWIDVAEDREQWRALVNTVMNLQEMSDYKFHLNRV
jgi:hypothetical protein